MLLLIADALLLLFICTGVGICMLICLQKLFRQPVHANSLGVILAGLVLLTIYFNLLSFWLPVNYISLLPPAIVSIYMLAGKNVLAKRVIINIQKQLTFVAARQYLPALIPIVIMLMYSWFLPPGNADGPGYHYASIAWFEKYKAVPGLGNINGRLGFNSVAFIIQSAFAFSNVAGQPLYPLNGVLTILFSLWVFCRVLRSNNIFSASAYFILQYLFNRVLLVNTSSATGDTLTNICLAYAIIQLFDAVTYKRQPGYVLLPLVILFYAVTVKLSAYPALLLALPAVWLITKQQRLLPVLLRISFMVIFIYLPWLGRNIILSGYLLYPVPFIDVFNVDWKAPKDVLLLDYTFIKRMPLSIDESHIGTKPPVFPLWVIPWAQRKIHNGTGSDVYILLLTLCSPVWWLITRAIKINIARPVFYSWLIVYACIIIWFANTPEFRFGIVFISFALLLPCLYIGARLQQNHNYVKRVFILLFAAQSVYYLATLHGRNNIAAFNLPHFVVYPLKDRHYYYNNDTATFTYTQLNNGVKLYHQDSTHNCINVTQPCMELKYGIIEMRGLTPADGFRNVQNDVSKNYPFIK